MYANQYIKNSCAAAVSGNKDFMLLQNNFKQNVVSKNYTFWIQKIHFTIVVFFLIL